MADNLRRSNGMPQLRQLNGILPLLFVLSLCILLLYSEKGLQVQGAQPLLNCLALLWYDDVIESFNIFTSNDVESYTKF